MADLSVLKNHIDISIQGNSGVVSTSGQATNFFLSVSKEDILSYTRSGNDLVIEFKNGKKLQIEGFFAYGLGFHNLVFVDEGKWLVNFTQALSVHDDSIIDANIYYEELKYNDSVGALLGILAGVGAAAGIGAALLHNDDVPKRQSEKPDTPSVSTVVDNTGPVTGPIKSGDVTDETQPELSGKGTPGNEIIIRDGDDIIGKVIVDKDGNWKWKPDTPLGEGDHSLTASEKDKAGNESERSDPVDFEVDTIAPSALDESRMHLVDDFGPVTGEIERGGVTDDKTPTYGSEAGSVDPQDVDHINIYHTDRDGHKVHLGRAAVQADGSWSFDPNPPLSPGDYVLSARPVDKAGNEGPETSGWNFRILGDAPAQPSLDEVYDNFDPVVGKVEKGSVTNDTTPVVKGTGTAGSIITVYVMGPDGKQFVAGTTTVKSDGTWSMKLTTPLGAAGDGEYIIQARAGDIAGQRSAMTGGHPVILDTTAPDVPSQPILVDRVGDVTGPVVSGGTTDDKQPAFCGQVHADEAGGTVRIYDNGRKIGEATIDEDGRWSWTPPAPGLDDGRHAITTTVTDKAGNVSAPSDPFDFTLDTSQVGISFSHFEDNYGPITGNISSGGATDDRRPTLVGVAGESVTVEVSYVDSRGQRIVLGVTRTDSRGNWKLIPDVDLADGHYVFTATATNNAGNTSQTDFELEIDGTAPAAPVLDRVIDDVGLVQGPISSGETTDDPTPTFHGRNGEPGTVITIRDQDGRMLGTATVRPDGTWTITTDALSEGSNQLAITATDKVGNVSDETHFEVVLDTQAPTVSASLAAISDDTGTSSSDFITSDNTLVYTIRVNGSLEAGDTVWLRIVDSDGRPGSWIRAVAKGGDIWTVDRNSDDDRLADGHYTIETVVRDAAGNEGSLSKQAVVIDTKGPLNSTVAITSYYDDSAPNTGDFGSGSFTNDRSPLLKGTASGLEAGDIITIYQNGVRIGTTTVDANGNWSYQLDGLDNGKYVYKAIVTDAAGNEGASSAEFDFTVNTTTPDRPSVTDAIDNTGPVTGPIRPGDVTDETRPEFSGKGEPGSEIIIRDGDAVIGSAIVDRDGNWSWQPDIPLGEGDHSLSVSAKDRAGNESDRSDSLDFTVDTTAPDALALLMAISDDTGVSSNDFITNDKTLIYTIKIDGTLLAGDTVWMRITRQGSSAAGEWIQAVANGDGTYSVDHSAMVYALDDGTYIIDTMIRDAAGNNGRMTSDQLIVVDTAVSDTGVIIDSYTDRVGKQTGRFGSDTTTDDRAPTLNGSLGKALAEDEIVVIYHNNRRLEGRAVVYQDRQGNWKWNYDLPDLENKSDNAFRAVVEDISGNKGKASGDFNIHVELVVTVDPQVTIDRTPIITGSVGFKIRPGEYVEVSVNGVIFSSKNGAVVVDPRNNTWYVQIPDAQALAIGKYDVVAILKREDGTQITIDNTLGELTIAPQPSVTVGAGGTDPDQKATALTMDENGQWLIFSNQAIMRGNGKNNATLGDFSITNVQSQSGGMGNRGNNYVQNGTWMDYNRDGYMDFFGSDNTYGNGQQAFLNNGNGTYTAKQIGWDGSATTGQVAGEENRLANVFVWYGGVVAFDKTGDGYADIVYGDQTPEDPGSRGGVTGSIVLNRNGTLAGMIKDWEFTINAAAGGSPFAPTNTGNAASGMENSVVDLDNNGTVDLIYHGEMNSNKIGGAGSSLATTTNSHRLVVAKNQGNGGWYVDQILEDVFKRASEDPNVGNANAMTWADFNGDGYMDLFMGRSRTSGWAAGRSDESILLFNDGRGHLVSSTADNTGIGHARGAYRFGDDLAGGASLAVDWNHDGRMDIIELPTIPAGGAANVAAGKGTGPVNLYLNNSKGGVTGFQTVNMLPQIGMLTIGAAGDFVTGAVTADVNWDGAKDLLIFTQKGHTRYIENLNKVEYGTSLHFKILDHEGINVLFGNTVQLYDSRGKLVSAQIINPQSGNQTNDSSAIVDFYGLNPDETYSLVLLRNIMGKSAHVGGLASLGGHVIENVNAAWTGLKAGEANHAYVLTAEAEANVSNANKGNGIVGTGYNDTFYATRGIDIYNGGGGTITISNEKIWSNTGGQDIVDFKLAGNTALVVDLGQKGYQNTGFNTARFLNIEGIAGGNGDDTFTDDGGDNIFNGRGGDDTFFLINGGKDTLLYELLDDNDATGGNGHDTVHGFTVGTYEATPGADRIDLHGILKGYTADADGAAHYINGVAVIDAGDRIADYLSVRYEGGNTVLYIDRDGTGSAFEAAALLTMTDTQVDLATLLANHQIVVW